MTPIKRLYEISKAKNITEFSKLIGHERTQTSKWLSGKHDISLSKFTELCKIFKIKNYNKLFKDES